MAHKKLFMKTMSSILAIAVAAAGFTGVPAVSFAAGTEDSSTLQTDMARKIINGLTDFKSKSGDDKIHINNENKTVTLDNANGNHFAIYNGLAEKTNDFVLEADVSLLDGGRSAALVFGASSKDELGSGWYGANIDTEETEKTFRIFHEGTSEEKYAGLGTTDVSKTIHLEIDVKSNGEYIYSYGNKDGELYSLTGTINNWQGGYVGILTFSTKAEFSNILFENRQQDISGNTIDPGENYKTNLQDITVMDNADWEVTEEGLYSNAAGKGDSFLYSQTKGTDFVYSTDVTFKQDKGAAALVFRSNNISNNKDCYVVNINAESKKCRFWRWQNNEVYDLIDEKEVEGTSGKYTLKVAAIGTWISYYVNDILIASTGDYTLQKDDRGQGTCIEDGYFGLLNWDGEMVFQNTIYKEINEEFTPLLKDITVKSSVGTVEEKSQFFQTEPINIQYVKNDAETVNLEITKENENAVTTITDADGTEYTDGNNIPVAEGVNYINVKSSITTNDGPAAEVIYRVNVHRRQPDAVYYNEPNRGQYHYSVKDGWGNDPNGLVYYKGTYHFFYQFYDDIKWGPMHWAHATSTDLIHWEEKPIAFYPDANGAMFSGCIVADDKNTSGLFGDSEEGGLVALITEDGNGQRIKVAYSEDEGNTWTKYNKIVADWTDDELHSEDFRDPKVFRWENKWFMVVAGGQLRIYSSDNLLDWKCESTYPGLHTECPDLYPLVADNGQRKWVLSRGGRFYKIGDFKEIGGKWSFVPDEAYWCDKKDGDEDDKDEDYGGMAGKANDGIMNFGKDSYAAMTWYVQDFGTTESPELPEILEINWANTWEDYCNLIAEKTGQKFNGIYNLVLKAGIKNEDGKYVLTQTPINKYEELRDTDNPTVLENVTVSEDNDLLKDFKGDCYEIVSKFTPAEDTKKIGFKVRTGNNQETAIIYDLETEKIYIDRSKSGVIVSGKFEEQDSQVNVKKNADGTVDLHIYVDRGIVEVFTKDYTVAGANQIFPSVSSLGQVYLQRAVLQKQILQFIQ